MTHAFEASLPRLTIPALLAAPLVYGLFLVASWLIQVDEVVLVEKPDRPLERITPEVLTTRPPIKVDTKPLTLADKPPPPPRIEVTTTGTAPGFTFAPPVEDVTPITFRPGPISVSPLVGRNIQVVRAPAPSMPAIAVTRGISGDCEVFFNVDTRGRPFDIAATCTDDIFRAEAIRSVGKAEFLPKVNAQGIAVEQHGAIYPLEFRVK